MKPMKAKAKTKKNGTKFQKVKLPPKDTSNAAEPDLSNLRKPIDISVSSLCQVTKLLQNGTEEIKAILAYECDIVYECRICRSLFRSLVNFISHKRVYCKEKYNIALNRDALQEHDSMFDKNTFSYMPVPEETKVKESCSNVRILRSQAPKEQNKKDLTTVIDMLQKRQKINDTGELNEKENDSIHATTDSPKLVFEVVETNQCAVYQTIVGSRRRKVQSSELMKAQVIELQGMAENTMVLDPDEQTFEANQIEKRDSPIQIYGSDEETESLIDNQMKNLVCSICNARFATKKTLAVHMKTLHTTHRMCYPCPCCTSTFANTWSVYRHLFKVHRKTNDQVRKLRAHIQEKAFRKEASVTENVEKDSPSIRRDETQEWMDHLESDTELQRCGGCGKRFDRKAALSSHSQYCQRRIAAYNDLGKSKKSSKTLSRTAIGIENLSNDKETTNIESDTTTMENITPNCTSPRISPTMSSSPEITEPAETTIRVQAISTMSEAEWNQIGSGLSLSTGTINDNVNVVPLSCGAAIMDDRDAQSENERLSSPPSSDVSDTPEIIYTTIDNTEKSTLNIGSRKRKRKETVFREAVSSSTDSIDENVRPSFTKRNNVNSVSSSSTISANHMDYATLMESKIATIANIRKLQCLPCKRKFTSMTNLRRHVAIHIGWNRYRCVLCNFKCFVKCDCVTHCNKMHNAQNNRAVIADMVVEIPQGEYGANKDIMNINNSEGNIIESESVDAPASITAIPSVIGANKGNLASTNAADDVMVDDAVVITEVSHVENVNNAANTETVGECNKEDKQDSVKDGANSKRLDTDPDLRRMVMEVIFGSSDTNSAKEMQSEEPLLQPVVLDKDVQQNNEIAAQSAEIEDPKASVKHLSQSELRSQRPVRNRVKPVNKDFLYDFKDVTFRKDSVAMKSVAFANCKSINKRSLIRVRSSECNIDASPEEVKDSKVIPINNGLSGAHSESDDGASRDHMKASGTHLESPFGLSPMSHVEIVQQSDISTYIGK